MRQSRRDIRRRQKAARAAKIYKYLAIILIVAGLGVFGYTGFEYLSVQYRQARLREEFEATAGFRNLVEGIESVTIEKWQPMRLIAPSIDMDLMAVGGGDVFDEALLDQGPTHFEMSDLPSTKGGNVAFAGHRAGRWNFFLNIDKLEEGDEIYLEVDGYRFIYHVEWVKVFSKFDWEPVDSTDYPAITLQTCEPPHVVNPDYRLFARGRLYDVEQIQVESAEAN